MSAPRHARSLVITAAILAAIVCAWRSMSSPATFLLALTAAWAGAWAMAALWSAAPRRALILRFAAVHAALFAIAALLEIPALLGILDYRLVLGTPIVAPSRDPRYRSDPELIYVARPHDRIAGSDGRGDVAFLYDVPDRERHAFDVAYDDAGFRNPPSSAHADVAVVGDSFVEAHYVAADEVTTAAMSRLLGVGVTNLGQHGYGPQQEAAVVRRFALPKEPRVVVWVFFEGNDLENIGSYDEQTADPAAAHAARHGFAARSFVRNALESLMFAAGNPRPSALPRSAWWTAAGHRERLYFLYPSGPLDAREEAALPVLRDVLAGTQQRCAAAGARLVVAFAPDKFRVCRGALSFDPGAEAERWTVNDLPERIGAMVRGLPGGVKYVDLTPALAARADAGELPYFRDDSHWNAAGNRIAAEALASVVRPLLAAPSAAEDAPPAPAGGGGSPHRH